MDSQRIKRVKEGILQQIEGARRQGWLGIQGTYEDALAVIEELEKEVSALKKEQKSIDISSMNN